MNTHYRIKIYVLCDPCISCEDKKFEYIFGKKGVLKLKFEPFYIGCARFGNHRRHLWNSHNELINERILEIRQLGKDPILRILKMFNIEYKHRALVLEKKLIETIGRMDLGKGSLLNLSDGGLGTSGYKFSKEDRSRMRERNLGKKASKETRLKMSEKKQGKNHPLFGKSPSDETRNKIGIANKEKFAGEKNPSSKLMEEEVLEIRKLSKTGWTQDKLSKKFKVSQSCISMVILRQTWIYGYSIKGGW